MQTLLILFTHIYIYNGYFMHKNIYLHRGADLKLWYAYSMWVRVNFQGAKSKEYAIRCVKFMFKRMPYLAI